MGNRLASLSNNAEMLQYLQNQQRQQYKPQPMNTIRADNTGEYITPQGERQSAPAQFQSARPITLSGGRRGLVDAQGNIEIDTDQGKMFTTMAQVEQNDAEARYRQQIADMPRLKALAEIEKANAAAAKDRADAVGGGAGSKPTFNADMGGYVYPPSAESPNGRFVPVAGAKKPEKGMLDYQGKSANFGARAAAASDIITELESADAGGANSLQWWQDVPIAGRVANAMSSADTQRLAQARRDFVNANLRLESGATIQQNEFDSATQQYFPQPNDTPEAIAQKRMNRERQIAGLSKLSGPVGAEYIAEQRALAQPPTIGAPKIGDIQGGHVFIGGNPANPSSWRKQ